MHAKLSTNETEMQKRAAWLALAAAVGLFSLAVGCAGVPAGTGRFDRTLTVTGPVRLEVVSSRGDVRVGPGAPGQVTIRGEFELYLWPWENARQRAEEVVQHPPIEQHGDVILIGHKREERNIRINYDITAPPQTELSAETGLGNVQVRGIRGPVSLSTGAGGITAEGIGDDAKARTGTGSIQFAHIEGNVRADTGAGSVTLNQVRGEIRAGTGTGGITIEEPGGRIITKTGSGSVTVRGAKADLRASTGSGNVTIEGDPAPNSYWELSTGAGGVDLRVPPSGSFRLYASTNSGGIESNLPIAVEEQSKRELRGRIGSGAARVDVHTGLGSIRIH